MTKEYDGQILEANLSSKQATAAKLDEKVARDFLGGLGLGVKILYDEVGPDIDALSPDNVIVIAPGPLSGTSVPTSSRTQIVTKSPLTGIIGTGNFGGFWGPRLKHAGFEAVVIRGRSDSAVYLWINDGVAEIRNAEHIWGKDSWETTDILKEELGDDVSVLSIGQAGENMVRFACPVIDYYHTPGRSHVGCVMGTKKLKAIAVRGTKKVAIADPDRFKEVVKEVADRVVRTPSGEKRKRAELVGIGAGKSATSGVYTGRNFQTGVVPPDSDLWRMAEAQRPHLTKTRYCYYCPYGQYHGCNIMADVKTGPYAGVRVGGISCGNSLWGPQCEIKSLPAVWKCRELCQRYGMDQGTPIPFAMELYQRGIITEEDTDGLELDWGNETAVMEMIRRIAYREGIGDVLAEGSMRAAKKIGKGAEKYALTVKGMELFRTEPRTEATVQHIAIAVSPRGGGNELTTLNTPESFSETISDERLREWVPYLDMFDEVKREIFGDQLSNPTYEPSNIKGKARVTKWYSELISVINSLGLCTYAATGAGAMGPTYCARLYSACTGRQITPREIMKTGERIFNLMRAYLVREGITRKDDSYPARFYEEPIPDGPTKGASLSRETMDGLLDVYYDLVEWDKKTGIPTKRKLVDLGLDYVADELS